MPIYKSKYFPESALAHHLLDGLKGVEIGGSIHNAFGLDVVNVDYTADMSTIFKQAERDLTYTKNGVAEAMPVDVVADGAMLPFENKSFDFVLNSHVVEHIFDPIGAIKEWLRVARKYVYMVVPFREATPTDIGRPLTTIQEFMGRHSGAIPPPAVDDHRHWSVWSAQSFVDMCEFYGFKVLHRLDVDDKVGNGFVIVLDAGEGASVLQVNPQLEPRGIIEVVKKRKKMKASKENEMERRRKFLKMFKTGCVSPNDVREYLGDELIEGGYFAINPENPDEVRKIFEKAAKLSKRKK